MTTNNESSRVDPATANLFISVSEEINAIHQKNYSEDSSPSHPLSFPCIYKVSKDLRKLNKSAYNPWVVSIGPIHNNNDDELRKLNKSAYNPWVVSVGPIHNNSDDDDDNEEQHLKEMEHIKVAYTEELLCRVARKSASPEVKRYAMDKALMECSTAMLHLAASTLNCYAENLKPIIKEKIPQHKLAKMLLIDGCFILELLYRSFLVETVVDPDQKNEITQGDPLLGNSMIMSGIQHDLLLLENQLPFFILKELFSKTIKNIPEHPWSSCPSLTQFVLSFFGNMMNVKMNVKKTVKNDDIQRTTVNPENDNYFHILHLLHSFYLSKLHDSESEPPDDDSELSHFSHRASDIKRAGVKFVPGKDQFDVHFKEASGLLWWCDSAEFKIPPLYIDDFTEPFLRNLIAFEQCCPRIKRRLITSYAFLMDSLIDSAADVELLENDKIIKNYLGASEEASVLFNDICKYAEFKKFDFAKPRNDAENHCRRLWPKFLTSLKRDYFSNPWSGIAAFGAFILFVLAVVQTVYTLLEYYGVEYGNVRELYGMHSVL